MFNPIDRESLFRQVRIVVVCNECQSEGYFHGDTKTDAIKYFSTEGWFAFQTDEEEADALCPACITKVKGRVPHEK